MNRVDGSGGGTELTSESLSKLDPRLAVPSYDRTSLGRGIVHIGVGSFHRAHQAMYLDDLCMQGLTDWSITGAGVLPGDAAMAAALEPQDYLYTRITRDATDTTVRVLGPIVDYVLASPSLDPLIERIADPGTRIVSLTITEGGYPVDEASGEYLAAGSGLSAAFEAIARGLQLRRRDGRGGLTIQSCDNVMHNGNIARAATLGVAAAIEPGLDEWVARNVAFPNSMVDGIVPATTDADREFLAAEYGLIDRWPVVAEPWRQWVLEDDFRYGRPPWEDVGALFVSDVEPYETLKLRLLNAGHSTLTYLAALVGHVYVHDVLADPPFNAYLKRILDDEATPSLPPVPGIDVEDYKRKLTERFANPGVKDQVARLCLDGTSKFPKFLVPTIESQLDKAGQVKLSALALAGWCQYLLGTTDEGDSITLSADPHLETAIEYAQASLSDPAAFLGMELVFGPRLGSDPVFNPAFVAALSSIREVGTYRTLDIWLAGEG
jgi:mannitol 2-dehydrogenase